MRNRPIKLIVALVVVAATIIGYRMFKNFRTLKVNEQDRAVAVELVVWTTSSFMDIYGPGPILKAEFEKSCVCTVKFIDAGGTQMAIERLKLDSSRRVDVLLGIDILLLPPVFKHISLQELDRPNIPWRKEVEKYVYPRAIPYDWAPMGLLYRRPGGEDTSFEAATSWNTMLEKVSTGGLALQDPTLSSPGLQFMYWLASSVASTNPSEGLTESFRNLKNKVHSYSPSWSASYGLFRNKQVPFAFSYLTSLIYHWSEEKDFSYQFLVNKSGHPMQVEYAVVPNSCWNCNEAKAFVKFLTSSWAQKIIGEKNYMLPVNSEAYSQLGPLYQKLPEVPLLGIESLDRFSKMQEEIINTWRELH